MVLFLREIGRLDCFALKSKIQAFFPSTNHTQRSLQMNPASRSTIYLFSDAYNRLKRMHYQNSCIRTVVGELEHPSGSLKFHDVVQLLYHQNANQ